MVFCRCLILANLAKLVKNGSIYDKSATSLRQDEITKT